MFQVTTTDITAILGYAVDVFSDFKLLFILIVGLFIGFWILEVIISIIRKD